MNKVQEATAVAPVINGKDVAVHTVKTIGSAMHIGITALADIVMYSTAHIVKTIDKTQTVQDTTDYIQARTNAKLEPLRNKLSGYKPLPADMLV